MNAKKREQKNGYVKKKKEKWRKVNRIERKDK